MKKFKYIYIIIILLFSFETSSNQSKDLIISGNSNIDKEVIISIIDDYSNTISDENINYIIKKLITIPGIDDVKIFITESNIEISIIESPKIININFIGNERFKKNEIFDIIDLTLLDYYDEEKINEFVSELEKLYLSFGYNQININYNLIDNPNDNFTDLSFDIKEGKISKINKINFIGNSAFKSIKLKDVIKSKERNLLKFNFNSNFKFYQLNNDKILLQNFYKSQGYKNIQITTKSEYIQNKNKFNLYFIINEGIKFNFSKIDINYDIKNIENNIKENLNNLLNKYKNDDIDAQLTYNNNHIANIKELLTDHLFDQGLMFFEINTLEKVTENKVDILFDIKSVQPLYVKSINIYGNTRTLDQVIRREISFSEGDPVNSYILSKANNSIQRLDFFESVDIKESVYEDKSTIDIFVKEKPTGDFKIGASFGTLAGTSFLLGLNEKNIGGKGRNLEFTVDTSDTNTTYSLNVVEPYIFSKKLSLIYGANYSERNYKKSLSYNLDKFETKLGFKYMFTNDISHSVLLKYNHKDYQITDRSTVASSILKSEGENTELLLDNIIIYNKLDSFLRPTTGVYASFITSISPSETSDNGYFKNILKFRKYNEFKNNIFSAQTQIGNISSLDNLEILTDNKFSLGGRWLRGFDSYGAGPRNSSSSYVGGNNIIVTKFDISRPLNKNSDNPIDLNFFSDIGKVWDNKIDPTNSNESIRSSYGYGIKFYTPIGPVGFSWAYPIASESYDNKRMFLFSIGDLN